MLAVGRSEGSGAVMAYAYDQRVRLVEAARTVAAPVAPGGFDYLE